MSPDELRAQIPGLRDVTYMNYGATAPSPQSVVESAQRHLQHQEFEATADEGMYSAATDAYENARTSIAEFVGSDPSSIALTESTTDGLNRIACAFPWNPGDVVVRTDLEHPAGILPWLRQQKQHNLEIRVVESKHGRLDIDSYTEAVQGASLVLISAMTWTYGTRLPVGTLVDIAHEAGADVVIDAVQWVGQVPADFEAWNADAIAATGHKWLLGTWGSGFLHVDESFAEQLDPGALGWRSVETVSDSTYELSPGAARFELSTADPSPHVALARAISLIDDVGVATIEHRITELTRRFIELLPDECILSPHEPESGLVTIDVDDPETCVERLNDMGIVIRSLPHPAAIRVSIHAVNTETEVETVARTISDMV